MITEKITPIHDHVLVKDMSFGDQVTKSGIILSSDDGKVQGVKPRWSQVWAIGPEQTDVSVGDWVLVEHGRWTRGINVVDHNGIDEITIRRVESKSMMAISDHCPDDINLGTYSMPNTAPDFDFSQKMY